MADALESFISKIPSILRPVVLEFLNNSGILIGTASKSLSFEAENGRVFEVQIWEVITGKPAFFAIAELKSVNGEAPKASHTRAFVEMCEARTDTVDWFTRIVTDKLSSVVDV